MIRRVRLARVGLLRRVPMPARSAPLLPYRRRHAATGTAPARTDWDPLRGLLWARCGAYCEACGKRMNPLLWDAHHRLMRSQGGQDDASNLVALHPSCHTGNPWSVHMRPEQSYERGLLVHSGHDPASAVLVLREGRRVLLDAVGGYLEAA